MAHLSEFTLGARRKACISGAIILGIVISITAPAYLLKNKIYSDFVWVLVSPGWLLFSVGRDDFGRMLLAVVFDAMKNALLFYVAIWCFVKLLAARKT